MTVFSFLRKKTSKKLTAFNLKIFVTFHSERAFFTALNFI